MDPQPPSATATGPSTDAHAVQGAYDKLRAAWNSHGGLPIRDRLALLKALKKEVQAKRDTIAEAISKDYGTRAHFETQAGEVFIVLSAIDNARTNLRDWAEPQEAEISWHLRPATGRIVRQPRGVVAVIAPWNYPVQLALGPLVAALAAGNRVLVKTSELTPATNEVLEAIVRKALPDDVAQVVHGDARVGEQITHLPLDHIFFTGSTRVGKRIMAAAAENLTSVTLELGGKSPVLVHSSFSVTKAAERVVWAKMFNSGQTCVAPDYVYVPAGQVDDFVAAAKAAYTRMYPTMVQNPDHTAIISTHHFQRLARLAEEARAAGVRVEHAGNEAADPTSRKMPLTLMVQPADTLGVMQEEIFGPLLPILSYDSIDSAIAAINARPRPLALYYFDHRSSRIQDVLARTTSGGAAINECLAHVSQEELPFGGIGPSGIGNYHGLAGFRAFSHEKSVFQQARINAMSLLNPPYGGLARAFAKWVTSW